MNTSEPILPKHLYIESTATGGTANKVTFEPEKLIAWSEVGGGDAIDNWCRQICDEKIAAINTWEDDRILELEDEWVSSENDVEEEDEDEEEKRYHLACEVVSRDAEKKREIAREQMAEHKAAIEKLVRQARTLNVTHTPPKEKKYLVGYLLVAVSAVVAIAAVAYVLIT
jgi:hypothetical protein